MEQSGEQSQEIEVEELEFSEHAVLFEAEDLETETVENSDGQQVYYISEDGVVTKLAYENLSGISNAIVQEGDGTTTTEYLVFSSIEDAQSGEIPSSHEQYQNFEDQIIPVTINAEECESDSEPIVSSTTTEEISALLTIPGKNVHPWWTTVDEIIEQVVQHSLSYAERMQEETGEDPAIPKKYPKKSNTTKDKDPMTLPFSYTGQSFNIQSQKLILNVVHFFKTHKDDDYIDKIKTPMDKAAKVLNISPNVIGKIRKCWKKGQLVQPGTKRRMLKRVLDKVSESDEKIIRDIIDGFINSGSCPTIPLILRTAREQIQFTGSRTSFRRILHRMGYRYAKIDKQVIMIDSSTGSTVKIKNYQKKSDDFPLSLPSSSNTITKKFMTFPRVSSSSNKTVSSKLVEKPESQLQQEKGLQQQSESNQMHQVFTIPISAYSHNLPLSIATPSILQDPVLGHLIKTEAFRDN